MTDQTTHLDTHYQEKYNQESTVYDEDRFEGLSNSFACQYKNNVVVEILRKNGITQPEQKIVDVPAGTGRMTHQLLRELDCQVAAVDISTGMLERNRQQVKSLEVNQDRIEFFNANMKELPFADETVDAVTMASFFYLVPQKQYPDYLADVVRVLKPNGIVIAEFSNAAAALNPLTQFKVLVHRFIKRKEIKSYPFIWELSRLLPQLKLEGSFGTEYPRLTSKYEKYARYCSFFGRMPILKSVGGKFTLMFRKITR